jgi:hypothetical protein
MDQRWERGIFKMIKTSKVRQMEESGNQTSFRNVALTIEL